MYLAKINIDETLENIHNDPGVSQKLCGSGSGSSGLGMERCITYSRRGKFQSNAIRAHSQDYKLSNVKEMQIFLFRENLHNTNQIFVLFLFNLFSILGKFLVTLLCRIN